MDASSSSNLPDDLSSHELFKLLANCSALLYRQSLQERREGYSQALREMLVFIGQRASHGNTVPIPLLVEFITKLEQSNGRNSNTNPPASQSQTANIERSSSENDTVMNQNNSAPTDVAVSEQIIQSSSIQTESPQQPERSITPSQLSPQLPQLPSQPFFFTIPELRQTSSVSNPSIPSFIFGQTVSQFNQQPSTAPSFGARQTSSVNQPYFSMFDAAPSQGGLVQLPDSTKRRWATDFGSKAGCDLMTGLDIQTKRAKFRREDKMSD
ncbi:hypothetical protein HK096_008092 [Nowakowskiella sp. JEL0078]|nr:hypothetical protein HK096_008092 [Nowakowskiella sp. JEL0078]